MYKHNEIISNFYLIRENGRPIYVGYTNRDIKKRFKEHINEKDFTGDATVEEVDSLSFPFTWDINTINQYAKQVSDRETSLITEYGTSSSIWQKGVNRRVGGQTWADIKHFVSINRNNPKFAGVEEADVVELIAYQKIVKQELQSVISNTTDTESRTLRNVIDNTKTAEHIRLHNVIRHTDYIDSVILRNVINNTSPKEAQRLKNVIIHTIPKETQRLKDVIGNTKPKETVRLQNIISHTIPKETQRLNYVIGNTRTHKRKEIAKLRALDKI